MFIIKRSNKIKLSKESLFKKGLICLALSLMAFVMAVPGTAHAKPESLTLYSQQGSYDILPYIYKESDPKQEKTLQNILNSYAKSYPSPKTSPKLLLLETSTAKPQWVVFSVRNMSNDKNWLLSFGQHFDGRIGLLSSIMVYNGTQKIKIVDTDKPPEQTDTITYTDLSSENIPIELPYNKTTTIIMRIIPELGIPTALPLKLIKTKTYQKNMGTLGEPANLMALFVLLVIGCLIGASFFAHTGSGIFFAAYFSILFILFHIYNNQVLAKGDFATEIPGILINGALIFGIWATRMLCGAWNIPSEQTKMFHIAVIILFIPAISSLILPDGSIVRPILTYVPTLSVLIFLSLFSLLHAYKKAPELYLIMLSWLCAFGGLLTTILSATKIIPTDPFFITALWWALIPQALFILTALVIKTVQPIEKANYERNLTETNPGTINELKESRDTTENKRLLRLIEHERQVMNELRERELAQNKEMREAKDIADLANRAKSAFLAVVSHEIRTPMTGIMGMVRLLLDTKMAPEQKEYAKTIQDSGDTMLALLNDILDFEKIETGKLDLEEIDFDFSRLINDIITLMSGHARAKNIEIKAEIDPSLPDYIIADPVRLRQVLLNLTGNAIKFTDSGSVTIIVKPSTKKNSPLEQGIPIYFGVKDTGIGISPEAQENLFNPFSQADSTITRKFGGSGLGLVISQRLIEAMGGKIEIDSKENEGAVFHYTITLKSGSLEAAEASSDNRSGALPGKQDTESLKILVVEDNEVNQTLIKEFLGRMGHSISQATSAEAALELIDKHERFDMILMDIGLPGISGIGATKAIRALDDKTKASVPVFALTGNVQDKDIRQCYAANMNGHIPKPIEPEALQKMIQKMLDGQLPNPLKVEGLSEEDLQRTAPLTKESAPSKKEIPPTLAPKDNSLIEDDTENDDQNDDEDEKNTIAPIQGYLSQSDKSVSLQEESSEENDKEQSPLLDEKIIESLKNSLSPEQIKELMDSMFEKSEEILASLRMACEQNNLDEIYARAHELKGMTGNFGLKALSDGATELETASKNKDSEKVNSILNSLSDLYNRSKKEIEE